ncbi:signal peptidase I [Neobacillus sp. MM2021_6]|uniref:signal peptidase I n=1 Tax=Bacillaceae TaxID=186817 RepID=UPI00140B771B|nr:MULTISPECIES: signal peptidase I [Bacillaceae]MBO0959870.1 signal peptidase I [Neobacillus sp. MM2021_6]NHC20482.1 signal peptidase I [Bacillus sp. MM2020_4]
MRTVGDEIQSVDITLKSRTKHMSSILSWIKFIISLIVVIFIFRFVFGITIIDGNSMNPTYDNRDVVLTSHLFYKVERNDVVIVKNQSGFNIIKRIIALPGETVRIEGGIVYVNGNPVKEPFTTGTSNDMPETKVEKGSYFIMGDNRAPGESLDSRSTEIGQISREAIIGETMISIIPFGIR